MDKNYVRYQDRYKKKSPHRADHLKAFQFQKGESGQTRVGLTAQETPEGEIVWDGEKQEPVGYVGYMNKKENRNPGLRPPWEPGESGNLDGRPIGSVSLVERLKAYLRRHPEEVEAIVTALVNQGKKGNVIASKELMDRIDGKVAETHKIEAEIPIKLVFRPATELLKMDEKDIIVISEETEEDKEETSLG